MALRSAEYETRAKECDDMANATRDLNQKQLWLAVARHWHELADKIRRAVAPLRRGNKGLGVSHFVWLDGTKSRTARFA